MQNRDGRVSRETGTFPPMSLGCLWQSSLKMALVFFLFSPVRNCNSWAILPILEIVFTIAAPAFDNVSKH